jgi:hypothetical protein
MTRQYVDTMLQIEPAQKTVGEFDGTAGKGLFKTFFARDVVGLFMKSDTKADWNVFICLPDPGDEDNLIEYPWFTICSSLYSLHNDQWRLPAKAEIKIKSTGVTNGVAQVIWALLKEK